MDKVLYFYSIRIQDGGSSYRLTHGTVEVDQSLTTNKQFKEVIEQVLKELRIDRRKAVFTSFSRL